MNELFNNHDKGELSQNFKDSLNYNIYLDGLEKRDFGKDKDKTSDVPENRLADSLESFVNLFAMNKVAEMDASMVIDKKEENSSSSDTQEKEADTLPPNTIISAGSSNNEQAPKDKSKEQNKEVSPSEKREKTTVHNHNKSKKLLEEMELLFRFRIKYTDVDGIDESNDAKATALKRFNVYLNGLFPDIDNLLKYLIAYKKRNTLSINEYEIILFIYTIPNAYKYILDQDDRFGLANYIFAKKISNTGEPIWNETELKFIYKETKRMYEARNV